MSAPEVTKGSDGMWRAGTIAFQTRAAAVAHARALTPPKVRRHGNAGSVEFGDGRHYLVTGHTVQVWFKRGHGRSAYRTVPYQGPTWWRVLDVFYPTGVTYHDGTPVPRRGA